MKLLVLGGTRFNGRAVVEEALARGHEVTVFHRGIHGAELFADVERITGDRRKDLSGLAGRSFDAAVDCFAFLPSEVEAVASTVASLGQYAFVSTQAVYPREAVGADERTPVPVASPAELEDAKAVTVGEVPGESYGPLYGPVKAATEEAVETAFPGRALIVRPGTVVGPNDFAGDRFTYWPNRVARGGRVLAPGTPQDPVQLIDVRDQAAWIVDSLEAGRVGVYNTTGPDRGLTFGELLRVCVEVTQSQAELVWISDGFLAEAGVRAWSDLPMWGPDVTQGLFTADNTKAVQAGLRFRPLAETVRDAWQWDRNHGTQDRWDASWEAELIERWETFGDAKQPRS